MITSAEDEAPRCPTCRHAVSPATDVCPKCGFLIPITFVCWCGERYGNVKSIQNCYRYGHRKPWRRE